MGIYGFHRLFKDTQTPKYLDVTIDRILTFKNNCNNIKMNIATRNSLMSKLTGTTWEANPHLLQTSLTLCYTAVEYAYPIWIRSYYRKKVDIDLNETICLITGFLKPTLRLSPSIVCIADIAPPDVRRNVANYIHENLKKITKNTHSINLIQQSVPSRLKKNNLEINHGSHNTCKTPNLT